MPTIHTCWGGRRVSEGSSVRRLSRERGGRVTAGWRLAGWLLVASAGGREGSTGRAAGSPAGLPAGQDNTL
jgi:hypothetical protein